MLIEQILDRHGLSLLGVADTAFVFARPGEGGEVVKVGLDPHDGWPAWASWAQAQSSPHVPRLQALSWIHDARGRPILWVARVERLRPSIVGRRWIKAHPHLKRDPLGLADLVQREHPALATLLRAGAAAFPTGHWDMGGPNWLERDCGTLVLNDPLSRT